ncbi:MAG: Pycsar system effector family protein [Bacteroidota bacterium]
MAGKTEKTDKLEKFDARGLQTLFRTLSRNHYNLIKMIDNKASILLTINSIIISIILGAAYMVNNANIDHISSHAVVIFRFSIVSMVIALLAMLPHKYHNPQKSGHKGSLYAGNYSKMSIEEYRNEMKRIMTNGHNIYNEMIDDLYYLGKAINIKHKLLLASFIVFIGGLLVAVVIGSTH